ncbi:MAG TPA: type II toxin-antitoxin system VapC family toxin [Candidatus Aphodovivens excrementavium]|nr:type II toxin-antitoxin system VapC family toxin [Candidatus Aphodovivens excrementavium]
MIVLDCSAAVEIARETDMGRGFAGLILQGETIIASDLFRAEVRNTMWKYVRAGMMPEEEARGTIEDALALVDEFVPLSENANEAFAEAVRQNHSVYDMFYLTLVRRNDATLFSADKKLAALCEEMGLNCVTEEPQ